MSPETAVVPGTARARVQEEAKAGSESGGAAEMARKLQNPLANMRALVIDNAIGFNTGSTGGTSYGFQFQPVYAIDMPEHGFTFLPRAVIPIVGLEPGTTIPPIGAPIQPADAERLWGIGDTIVQAFFALQTDSKWKWGIGPQFSFPTASNDNLSGSDWGGGIAGVVTGEITPQISSAVILGNMWSFNGDFSTALVQPTVFYNFASVPGLSLGYNAPITANWKASGDDVWTVPLGASVGRTFDLGGGNGIDLSIGPYYNVARPDGAADWVLRFAISLIFP